MGDLELRQEVERLLHADEQASSLLPARPPLWTALGPGPKRSSGQVILHYQLVDKIGEGGMGEVYKARDRRLDRLVALKFLFAGIGREEGNTKRFIEEARAASSLDHPNICTIHGIEQQPDGELFIVMPCYQGETIKDKIHKGPVPPEETLDLAIQVGRGLIKAHSAGIVHRDIKPANIIVTRDGLAKILDFGIAKLTGPDGLTQSGMVIGTIDYMSPEQALGRSVDHRTDIWAFGVVLYEMLTGHTPFDAPNLSSLLSSIFQKQPWPLTSTGVELSREWEAILRRALAADLAQRFQTTKELIRELESLRRQHEAMASGSENDPPAPSIAVLPFVSISSNPENEYFSAGLTDELIHALASVEGLRVVSRTTMFQFKGQAVDVREAGRDLHVSAILEGSVRAARNKVRITVRLVKVADGYQLWSEEYDRQLDDIFAVQDEIARNIVRALIVRFTEKDKGPLVKQGTRNSRAYRRYLKGRHHCNHWTPESLEKAIEYFRKALQLDPEYARAHAGLAEAHLLRGFWGLVPPREAWMNARKAAQAALLIDDRLAEAHACLAAVWAASEWNWAEARREFKLAISLNEGDPLSRSWCNAFYLIPHGLLEEALRNEKRHLDVDPLSPAVNTSLAWVYLLLKQHAAALQQARTAIELSPLMIEPYWIVGLSELALGRNDEAVENLEKARSLGSDKTFTLSLLIKAYASVDRQEDAFRLCSDLEKLSEQRYVAPTHLAWARLALNETDRAFEWLNRACEMREVMLLYLKILPMYDGIRSDPRFGELVRRIGLLERAAE
jgi:serine/threonine-protein kinase